MIYLLVVGDFYWDTLSMIVVTNITLLSSTVLYRFLFNTANPLAGIYPHIFIMNRLP